MLKRLFTTTAGVAILRLLATALGTWLASEGYIHDAGILPQAFDAIAQVSGPGLLLVGIAGDLFSSLRDKIQRKGTVLPMKPETLGHSNTADVKVIADQAIAAKKAEPKPLRDLLKALVLKD